MSLNRFHDHLDGAILIGLWSPIFLTSSAILYENFKKYIIKSSKNFIRLHRFSFLKVEHKKLKEFKDSTSFGIEKMYAALIHLIKLFYS